MGNKLIILMHARFDNRITFKYCVRTQYLIDAFSHIIINFDLAAINFDLAVINFDLAVINYS